MYTKLIGTFSSKVYSSAIGFIVIILTSRYLGAEGRGEISLFIANLTLVQLLNEIISGPALIYLVSRHKTFHLFIISIVWSVVASFFMVILLYFTKLTQPNFTIDLYLLSAAYAIFSSSMMLLQAKQKIKSYNLINIIQSSLLLIVLFFFMIILKATTVESYINTLYFSYLIPMLVSIISILYCCDNFNLKGIRSEFVLIFKTGLNAQISNFLNFFNTRISYYILAVLYLDKSSLGIFSLATSLVESVWLVSYSIATIQYPLIAASDNSREIAEVTLKFSKITFWASSFLILILLLLPEFVYLFIFGVDFIGIKKIILLLSPGIIVLSVSKIYWNYFSGIGKFSINNLAGFIGLCGTILTMYLCIANFGINGAAYSTVFTYLITSAYLFLIFKNYSGLDYKNLLPSLNDYKLLKKI